MSSGRVLCDPARNGHQTGTRMTQGTTRGVITARGITAMKPGEWLADPAARGAGRLQVRKLPSGDVVFYYRYTAPTGERVRLPLGSGLTLAAARNVARELSLRYQSGDRDLREVLHGEKREADAQRRADELAAEIAASRQEATLGALLLAYVAQLQRDGKASAKSVEHSLRRNVERAWPRLWAKPAADVTTDDLLDVIARLAHGGDTGERAKVREAGKVRSYLRAAYSAAIKARQSPNALPALRELRIASNPASDLATLEGAQQARERALSVAELRAYWSRIENMAGAYGALLRFHLLTGGQRLRQLARVTYSDHDDDTRTIRLRDPKGRRRVARIHDVPLIPAAEEAMRAIGSGGLGPFVFSINGGESGISDTAFGGQVRGLADEMTKAGELPGGPFVPSDLRRTVETRLAALGVTMEVRAQLQSHGLGGVQNRHYDRHDYLTEKRDALAMLHELVTGKRGKVVALRGRGADYSR